MVAYVITVLLANFSPTVGWAEDSAYFQINREFSQPSTYEVTGEVTPSKGQSRAEVGRWIGDWIQWDQGGQKESEVWNLKSGYGFLVHDPTDDKKNKENKWSVPFKGPLKIEGNPSFPASGHGSYLTSHRTLRMYIKTKTCQRPQIRFQSEKYGFAQIPCEKFPNVGNAIGIMFFPGLHKDDPDPYPGTWRQRYQAHTSLRIVKPGAKAGEKVRVRVVGWLVGNTGGRDKEHTNLDARIIADQIVDFRITGRNPRKGMNDIREVPVNVDLPLQFSFDLYSNGRAGRSDQHVEITQQELKLELLGPELAQTSAALSDVNYAFNQHTKIVSGQGPVALGLVNGTTSNDALVGKTLELDNLALVGCSNDKCQFQGGNLRFRERGKGKMVIAQIPNVTAVADLKAGKFYASVPKIQSLSNELPSASPLLAALRKAPGRLELDAGLMRTSKRFTQSGKAMQGPSTALYADLPPKGPVLAKPVPVTPPVPLTRPGQTGSPGNFNVNPGGLPSDKVTKLEPPKLTPKISSDQNQGSGMGEVPQRTPSVPPISLPQTNSLTVKPPVVLSIPGRPTPPPQTGTGQSTQSSTGPSGITTTKLADGTVITKIPGGVTITEHPRGDDGVTITYPDGTTTQMGRGSTHTTTTKPDGTRIIHWDNGATTTFFPDGRHESKRPDGITITFFGEGERRGEEVTSYPDGTTVTRRRIIYDGQTSTVVEVTRKPDGTTITKQKDGTTITTYPEGTTVTEQPGGTKITKHYDGRTVTRKPDGTKITQEPNGTTTTTYPDGRTVSSPPTAPPNPSLLVKPQPALTIPVPSPAPQGLQVKPIQPELTIPSNKSLSLGLPQKPAGIQPVPQPGSSGIQFSSPGLNSPSRPGSVPLVQQTPANKPGGAGVPRAPGAGLIIPRGVDSEEGQGGDSKNKETGSGTPGVQEGPPEPERTHSTH